MKFIYLAVAMTLLSQSAYAETMKRVLSIGGANTEIIYALGAEEMLVGNDTTSTYPEEANKLPKVGYMRALSAEGVLSLSPDLIILTEEAGPPSVIAQLKQANANLLLLKASRSIGDVQTNIQSIGVALNRKKRAMALSEKINADHEKLTEAIAKQKTPKKLLFVLQHGGGAPMVAGGNTAADSIIQIAGGVNAVTGYDGYKPLTPEAAVKLQPDFLLVTTRGLAQVGGIEKFKGIPGINLTNAGRQGRVISMNALYLLGFGPRTVEAALKLVKLQESIQ